MMICSVPHGKLTSEPWLLLVVLQTGVKAWRPLLKSDCQGECKSHVPQGEVLESRFLWLGILKFESTNLLLIAFVKSYKALSQVRR